MSEKEKKYRNKLKEKEYHPDLPAPPKSKISINEFGKEKLSDKILKSIENLNELFIEIRLNEEQYFKIKANRKRILIDTSLSLKKVASITIMLGGLIGGAIKLIA